MPRSHIQYQEYKNTVKIQPNSEIQKYFKRTKPDTFICKKCRAQIVPKNGQSEQLYSHVLSKHRDSLIKNEKEQKITQFNMFPQEEVQNENQQNNGDFASDEWLDRLALDGYPVQEILSSILMRYRQDSVTFGKYLCRRAKSLRMSKYRIKKYLPTLPINTLPSEIVSDLVERYRISEQGANLLLKQYFWCNQDDDLIFHELERRGITIKHYLQDRVNKVIFLCTKSMKKNYFRFGDTINLQFWNKGKIGFFMGQDTNILPTLFGILIIEEDRRDLYKIGVQYFLEAMKKRIPQTIITNDNQNILSALKELKQIYSFQYFINWYYVFKDLKDKLNSHFEESMIDQYISLFQKSLTALTIPQLHQQIRKITVLMDQNNSILCQFLHQSELYCMSKAHPIFIGFGIEIERTNIIHKILDIQLSEVSNLGFTLLKSIRIEEKLMNRLKNGYKIMDPQEMIQIIERVVPLNSQLHYLRRRMEYSAFKKVLLAYWAALNRVQIVKESMFEYNLKMENQEEQKVQFCVKLDCWECSCKLVVWSGLPCSHLIKILIKNEGLVTYYVNKRWFIMSTAFNPDSIFCQEQTRIVSEKLN